MSILSNYQDDTSSNCAQDAKQREEDLKTCVTSSAIKPIKLWVAEMLETQVTTAREVFVPRLLYHGNRSISKFARRNCCSRARDSDV